ncbi:MAG TPA: hypothetical protein DC049_15890 [Spirochaetia bacterium]|nr:hypothetical protein [Spirochaetia bacterium]
MDVYERNDFIKKYGFKKVYETLQIIFINKNIITNTTSVFTNDYYYFHNITNVKNTFIGNELNLKTSEKITNQGILKELPKDFKDDEVLEVNRILLFKNFYLCIVKVSTLDGPARFPGRSIMYYTMLIKGSDFKKWLLVNTGIPLKIIFEDIDKDKNKELIFFNHADAFSINDIKIPDFKDTKCFFINAYKIIDVE